MTTTEPGGDVRAAIVAAGLLPRDIAVDGSDDQVVAALLDVFDASCWWRPGDVAVDRVGDAAFGSPLPEWEHPPDGSLRVDALATAVRQALPAPNDHPESLRVRVATVEESDELLRLGTIGPALISPSFASRGSLPRNGSRNPTSCCS